MNASEVAEVEAIGAIAVLIGSVALIALRVGGDRFTELRAKLEPWLVPSAAVVAIVATLGSLWFSEVAHFPPCKLCWYQRIAMYPLALILTIAAVRRDASIRLYALVLASAGLAVNVWHLYVETFPDRSPGGCDPTNPCTIRWVEALGFWTIPRLAFAAFVWIIVSLALSPTRKEPHAR